MGGTGTGRGRTAERGLGVGEQAPDGRGGTRGLQAIVPDVLTVGADGEAVWEPTSDVGLYSDVASLTYDWCRSSPGRPSRPT